MDQCQALTSITKFTFHYGRNRSPDDPPSITVNIRSLTSSLSHGSHPWTSSLVLSRYIWHYRSLFKRSKVLELGCGTALPGLLCAILGAEKVVLTDAGNVISNKSSEPNVEDQLLEEVADEHTYKYEKDTFEFSDTPNEESGRVGGDDILLNVLNMVHELCDTKVIKVNQVDVYALPWGSLSHDNFKTRSQSCFSPLYVTPSIILKGDYNWILGADVFYNSQYFESLICTIAKLFENSATPNECNNTYTRCIIAYQERSSKRSIQHLLERWGLEAHDICGYEFGFNQGSVGPEQDENREGIEVVAEGENFTSNALSFHSIFLFEIKPILRRHKQ